MSAFRSVCGASSIASPLQLDAEVRTSRPRDTPAQDCVMLQESKRFDQHYRQGYASPQDRVAQPNLHRFGSECGVARRVCKRSAYIFSAGEVIQFLDSNNCSYKLMRNDEKPKLHPRSRKSEFKFANQKSTIVCTDIFFLVKALLVKTGIARSL